MRSPPIIKILAMVSIASQRFELGTQFDLDLAGLIPPGEMRDIDRIQAILAEALRDFDTPLGGFNVNLVRCEFYPEGMGLVQLQAASRQLRGTGITLMAGHRNLTFLTVEDNALIDLQTSHLGFHNWVKAVRAETYDYDDAALSTAVATYWNQGTTDCLQPILLNRQAGARSAELKLLEAKIAQTHRDYFSLITDWLCEYLPARIDRLTIAGGLGDVLLPELIDFFHDRLTPQPEYKGGLAIHKPESFNLPVLEVAPEYQSRMADVYCLWKYLMPPLSRSIR